MTIGETVLNLEEGEKKNSYVMIFYNMLHIL